MRFLCVLKKYQYGDPRRELSHEFTHFLPALRRLGHEVHFIDGGPFTQSRAIPELNWEVIRSAESVKPDVLFTVLTAAEIWRETFDLIRGRFGSIAINWGTDDNWRYRSFTRFVVRFVDAYITTYQSVASRLRAEGLTNVISSQWAAGSDLCVPPIPARLCTLGVVFIGSAHGYRKRWIRHLFDSGIAVSCFGHGWENGPVSSEDLRSIVRRAVVTLNFSGSCAFWQGTFGKKGKQLKARTFEVPAWGGFLLSEDAPNLDACFDLASEMDTFVDRKQLVEKVRFYLASPSERDSMAQAAHLRTITNHLYEHRFKDVIDSFLAMPRHAALSANSELMWVKFEQRRSSRQPDTLGIRTQGSANSLTFERLRRRLVFEASWRLRGADTYSESGWPSRLG